MTENPSDRRVHQRFEVYQPCRVTIGQGYFSSGDNIKGMITNASKGGAAIRFVLKMEQPPPVGTPVNVYIAGVGDFPS